MATDDRRRFVLDAHSVERPPEFDDLWWAYQADLVRVDVCPVAGKWPISMAFVFSPREGSPWPGKQTMRLARDAAEVAACLREAVRKTPRFGTHFGCEYGHKATTNMRGGEDVNADGDIVQSRAATIVVECKRCGMEVTLMYPLESSGLVGPPFVSAATMTRTRTTEDAFVHRD